MKLQVDVKWSVFQAGRQDQTGAGCNLQLNMKESFLMKITRKQLLNWDMMTIMILCFQDIAVKMKMIPGKKL